LAQALSSFADVCKSFFPRPLLRGVQSVGWHQASGSLSEVMSEQEEPQGEIKNTDSIVELKDSEVKVERIRSCLKKTSSAATPDGDESARAAFVRKRTMSKVSIGPISIEEVAAFEDNSTNARGEAREERLRVKVERPDGDSELAIVRDALHCCWRGTWGSTQEITVERFTTAFLNALERNAARERQAWSQSRVCISGGMQESRLLVREGGFTILSVIVNGQELDASDSSVIDLKDGEDLSCEAKVIRYWAPPGICVECCGIQ